MTGSVRAREDHPRRGPQYPWNAGVGKAQAGNPPGAELEQAEREVERSRAFLRLSQQLAGVNGRICRLRPPLADFFPDVAPARAVTPGFAARVAPGNSRTAM